MLTLIRLLLVSSLLNLATVFAQEVTVRSDTTFPVELRHTIRASSAKAGDPVELRLLEPVLIGDGIVVPANASLLGDVVFARSGEVDTPHSMLRIRVQTLRWPRGEVRLNAVVGGIYFARSSYVFKSPGPKTTFLEGITIAANLFPNASTDFSSDRKEVVLRGGILLLMRHIVSEDERTQTLSARSAEH